MDPWDDWDEDTPVEVLKRYLATFGEPAAVKTERHYHPPDPDQNYYRPPEFPGGCGAGRPRASRDWRAPAWVSGPDWRAEEEHDRRLEELHLGLSCPVSICDYRYGRRAGTRNAFRRRFRARNNLGRPQGSTDTSERSDFV